MPILPVPIVPVDSGFRPDRHGFAFANDWPAAPVLNLPIPFAGRTWGIGDASGGLCGGMSFLATDYYRCGKLLPEETTDRSPGSPLFRHLVRRFLASLSPPLGLLRVWAWTASRRALEPLVWRNHLPGILDGLRHGPVPLTLINVQSWNPLDCKHDHQVVAWAAERRGDRLRLRIYDPNEPLDNEVSLLCTPTTIRHCYSTDEEFPVRGFYRTPYSPEFPPAFLTAAENRV